MLYRKANIKDIEEILLVRNSVHENRLSNPDAVTVKDCEAYIAKRGRGWVCEVRGTIAGFAIIDLQEDNVWALFIRPEFEGRGIGRNLHNIMMDWYFSIGRTWVWLGTSPGTRADMFYRKCGWIETGKHGADEIKFEMTAARWNDLKSVHKPKL